jgi:sugar lactone lactonase YvrE
MKRIGDFTLTWGESLRWDDRRQRLYFVDCATRRLHWLDGGEPPLATMQMPSLPTGIVLTGGNELVVCLADGLYVVDANAGTLALLTRYPDGMHGRANDANADGSGNLVTGTLNIMPGPGALWWFSAVHGWRLLDDDFGNANGPAVIDADGQRTLVFGDTLARKVYAYPFDGSGGAAGARRVRWPRLTPALHDVDRARSRRGCSSGSRSELARRVRRPRRRRPTRGALQPSLIASAA